MKKQKNSVGLALILLLFLVRLAACSGTMKGRVQQGGESINFQFEDSGIGTGTLRTTLSDGETFKGKYADTSSSGFITGFDTEGTGATIARGEAFETIESYSGNIDAVLFGNKGRAMKCKFQAANPLIGLPGGGEGRCQISDGRVIDVQF